MGNYLQNYPQLLFLYKIYKPKTNSKFPTLDLVLHLHHGGQGRRQGDDRVAAQDLLSHGLPAPVHLPVGFPLAQCDEL